MSLTHTPTKLYFGDCGSCGREIEHEHPQPSKWGSKLTLSVRCANCRDTVAVYQEGYDPGDDQTRAKDWIVENPDVRFRRRRTKSDRLNRVLRVLEAVHQAQEP